MMISCKSAKQCVLTLSMSRMSRAFFYRQSHAMPTFLFDACFKYVCEHLFEIIGKDPVFAGDVSKVDNGQLWRDIFQSSSSSKKRKRSDDV